MDPFPIEFHPDAVNEAATARRWYSEISDTLGAAFADELDAKSVAASARRVCGNGVFSGSFTGALGTAG